MANTQEQPEPDNTDMAKFGCLKLLIEHCQIQINLEDQQEHLKVVLKVSWKS